MTLPKAVSVIGFKNSGKTIVVESLVRELTNRGYHVGTIKHTAENVPLDTPGKDTWRHREAGSKVTAILHDTSAALFIDNYLSLTDVIAKMGSFDFLIIEGFKSKDTTAKIIVPRNPQEKIELSDGLEIAIANLTELYFGEEKIPIVPIEDSNRLTDIVEAKAFSILAGLNCGGCGYQDCKNLAEAILAGEAVAKNCVGYSHDFSLSVDGAMIPLGPFVQSAFRNVVIGFVRSLKGVDEPKRVELNFEVVHDG
jgi:molybdopterin-guanine dinucleotide biosynthesis protein B